MKRVFSEIYRRNAWGDSESVSGPGSTVTRTAAFREELEGLLREIEVESILDAGCGDFNWMKEMRVGVKRYIGVDIVEEIIEEDRRRYEREDRTFIGLDITRDDLPMADLILCRDALVHFSFDDMRSAIRNFKKSGAAHLLTTTFTRFAPNIDIETGGWRQVNLEISPFNFPAPLRVIDEKCHHSGGQFADKRLSLWALKELPI